MKWYEKKQTDGMRVRNVVNRAKVLKYLASTDYYIIRHAETGVEVPQEVLDKRAESRSVLQ